MPPPNSFVSPGQFVILALFLGVMLLVWWFVQRNKGGLARQIGRGKRIAIGEVTALSSADRAMILSVDGREFLVVRTKGAPPAILPLEGALPLSAAKQEG